MLPNSANYKKTLIFLIAPLILVYFKSLFYDFSPLDDQWMIIENTKSLAEWSNIKDFFTKPLAGLYFRPILSISLMLDYHIAKTSPFIYHFSNLLYHAIAVILVYRLLLALGVQQSVALLFSVIFSVHPALVHAVAWIPGRNDTLLAIFSLSSSLSLIEYIKKQKQKFLLFNILFFVCALLTKENAIVLPIFFGLIGYYFKASKKNICFLFAGWLITLLIWYTLRSNCVHSSLSLTSNLIITFKNFLKAVSLYLGKSIFPVQQSVFPTLQNSTYIFGIVTLAIYIVVTYIFGFKDKFLAAIGIFSFFIFISIPAWYGASSSSGEHYEHRIYLPLVGLLIFVSQINFNQQAKTFTYTLYALIMVYSVKTFYRMQVYKTINSFTEVGINEASDYYYFYVAKADQLLIQQKYAECIPFYNIAIKMQPQRAQLYNGRGFAYNSIGKPNEAINDFTNAIKISNLPIMYLNRCLAYRLIGNFENAYNDLVYLKKNDPQIIPSGLENYLLKEWLQKTNLTINTQPNYASLHIQKAKILVLQNNFHEAKKSIEIADKLEPNNNIIKLYLHEINLRLKNS